MNDKERSELAADIARRVRTYAWRPMPAELAEGFGRHPFSYAFPMPVGPNHLTVRFTYNPRPARLEVAIDNNDRYAVERFLWTPEDNP